jgi:thiol-disulfide isomerase/thioredoxin
MNNFIPSKGQCWKSFGVVPWIIVLTLCSGVAQVEAAGGEENSLTSFGSGSIKVRLYTDYFCPPCRDMEPDLEPLLIELVKNGIIHLTFVDVPTSRNTHMYASYFIYSLGEKKDIDSAIHARRTLFAAAEKKVVEKNQLVNQLTGKGIGLKPVDLNPVFNLWNRHLQEDQIRSTPTCVIVDGDLKKTHAGSLEVVKALEVLRDNFGKKPAGHSLEGKKRENGSPGKNSQTPPPLIKSE